MHYGNILTMTRRYSGMRKLPPFRFLSALTAAVTTTAVLAGSASAEPVPAIPPAPGEGINIPSMTYGVYRGQECDIAVDKFGRTFDGLTMVCVADVTEDGDDVNLWVRSAPLAGVRIIGSSCAHESDSVALSPNDELLMCLFDKIVTDKKKSHKDRPNLVWTVVEA